MAATAEEGTRRGARKVTEALWPQWLRTSKGWDWQVAFQGIAAFAIPISVAGLIFSVYQFKAQQQAAASQVLDQRRQATLDNYLNDISALVLSHDLSGRGSAAPARALAAARTDTAVRNLDAARKGILIRYLWEAGLIRGKSPIVYLHKADLNGAVFRNAYLYDANLGTDYLIGADFYGADPHGANLSWADLSKADLVKADLGCVAVAGFDVSATALARQHVSSIDCTILKHTNLTDANLKDATLLGANLSTASLAGANLRGARYNARQLRAGSTGKVIQPTKWPAIVRHPQRWGAVCVGSGCPG